ncbi:LppP/LprE family lipoprotein [Curtobacterium sp. MCBD17_019]|uniref:LppP/LprE family lipoprotein n=1 Tax=Curtobacterium sp. MCBD17_019 TaxID=2175669 RepID=UPI000DAAC62E|nr:LppP/LprE family lipoprotein [Curtobacterium sp. MCBD17_019]PZE76561.1 LppP/LprE family lipoprotein [Curtobacterium sp. MCBD17_019]
MLTRRSSGLVLLGTALTVVLAGCSGGTTSPHPSSTARTVTHSTPTPSAAPASPSTTSTPSATSTCGPATGQAAAATGIAALPLPVNLRGTAHWDAAGADYSGYDPCAPLSWSVVTVSGSTASSPYAILLFHDGTYLGTATKEQYAFQPTVRRTSSTSIAVTYPYPRGNDSDADPSGRANATYTWDAGAGKVTMAGSTPPAQ